MWATIYLVTTCVPQGKLCDIFHLYALENKEAIFLIEVGRLLEEHNTFGEVLDEDGGSDRSGQALRL